jgi:hypothetical protein
LHDTQSVNETGYKNCKLSFYPEGYVKLTIANKSVFKDFTPNSPELKRVKGLLAESKPQNADSNPQERSISRARRRIFDIAALNPFALFVTLTLDPDKIERDNAKLVSRKLQTFFEDRVKRSGLFYLAVPEYHKDGKNIHIHCLINNSVKLKDSKKRTKDGKIIYNIPEWTLGFTTAIPLTGESVHVAKYITKYISKDFKKIFGNFYYAGGAIVREPPKQYINFDYSKIEGKEFSVPEIGVKFKYCDFSEVRNDA